MSLEDLLRFLDNDCEYTDDRDIINRFEERIKKFDKNEEWNAKTKEHHEEEPKKRRTGKRVS